MNKRQLSRVESTTAEVAGDNTPVGDLLAEDLQLLSDVEKDNPA